MNRGSNHKKYRLLIVTTHPIQYMAPWFRALARDQMLELEVIFFREVNSEQQGVGFGLAFQWDVPLREGYVSQVLGVASGLMALPRLLFLLQKAFQANRPDVVLVTGWNEAGLAAAIPLIRCLGVPVIVRGDSNALRPRSILAGVLHRTLLGFSSAALFVGKSNRKFYLDNGVPPRRLFAGVHFVESERMVAMATEYSSVRNTLRMDFGFGDKDFVFSFVGKHVGFKRPMLLVEAAAAARQHGWPVKLLFAGSGGLTDSLKRRAAELNVPAYFTGFLNQTEMWKAYVPADAFVLPSSNGETWGLVTNEAMLFGLPVIVSDQVGCGPDLVIEDETGYSFSGESEGLTTAMEKLLRNRERSKQMGEAGRKLVREHYSMSVATEGLKAALEAVCRKK